MLREVTVVPFDTDGAKGVSATSYIGVQGVNVPPTLQDITAGSVSEVNQADSSAWTDAGLSGTLVGADEDLQTLTYGISGGTTGGSYTEGMVTYDVSKAGSYGTLYVDSASGDYLYVPDSTKVNALTAGEAQTESFTVTVWDGVAAAVTKTYTINLTGANDAPTVVGALSDDANEAGALFTRDLLGPWIAIFGDPGGRDVLARLASEIQRQSSMIGFINAFHLLTLVPMATVPLALLFVVNRAPGR